MHTPQCKAYLHSMDNKVCIIYYSIIITQYICLLLIHTIYRYSKKVPNKKSANTISLSISCVTFEIKNGLLFATRVVMGWEVVQVAGRDIYWLLPNDYLWNLSNLETA